MSKEAAVVLGFVASIVLVATCGAEPPDAADGEPPFPGLVASGDGSAYPGTYTNLDLPVLPGGVVTSSGRQSSSLRDGLSIHLTSDKPVSEVRTFYQDAMSAIGWTPAAAGPGAAALNLPVAIVTFTRDQLSFSATITAGDSGSVVSITVLER
jgi:hypothetical protein